MAVELWRTTNPSTDSECYLHEVNWVKHAEKRPEIRDCLVAVRMTAEDPDVAVQDKAGVVIKYRKGFGMNAFQGLWLAVIEQAGADGAHFVKSMYFTSVIADHPAIYLNPRVLQRERR